MAAETQLPGTRGHVHIFVAIMVGLVLAIIGMPGRASAHPKPHPLSRKVDALVGVAATTATAAGPTRAPAALGLPVASPPSPHPAPGSGRPPSTRASMSHPAAPVPKPQAPPTQRPAPAEDLVYPHAVVVPDANLPVAAVNRTAITHRAAPRQPRAAGAIASDRLDRSLVYSSALALAIAAGGLLLIGSRRRLW